MAPMLWAVDILKIEQGKPPVVIHRLAHAADSIEEVKASMRAMLDTPDWRYIAYHLGHDHVDRVIVGGELT